MSSKKQSSMEQWFKRNCSWAIPRNRRVSSTSQHLDALPKTTTTNYPPTTVSRPLPLRPEQGTSSVDFVKPNIIVDQPSTVPDFTCSIVGEYIGLPHVSIVVNPIHRSQLSASQRGSKLSKIARRYDLDLGLSFNN